MNQAGRFNLDTFRKKLDHTLLIHQSQSRVPHIHERYRLNAGPAAGQSGIHPLGLDDDIGVKCLVRTSDFVKIRKIEKDSYLRWTLFWRGSREIGGFSADRGLRYGCGEQAGKHCGHK